jgi:TolB protein
VKVRLGLSIGLAAAAAALSPALAQPKPPAVHGAAPAVSPDGRRIAFLADRDGATDIYVIGADGSDETRLTHTSEQEGQPEWSADGTLLRFTVFADGSSRVYSIEPSGQSLLAIGSVPGRALRIARDGKRILYWTGTWTAMKVFESDLDGANARPVTDGSGAVWGARWSSDGRRIAYGGRDAAGVLHVFVMNANGSSPRQVSRFPASDGNAQMPAWSPDDRTFAVQAGARDVPAHIWLLDAASGSARKLAAHTGYVDETPAWFPDGKHIAFQSDRTGRMEIWVMDADGGNPRQVTR